MRAKYVMSEVMLGLWRNISMTIAMIITMAVSLAMLGAGLLMYHQVNLVEDFYQSNLEIVIFLEEGVDEEQIQVLDAQLNEDPRVAEKEFEDSEEAWANFQEMFEDNPSLVASTDPEKLPSSFRVKLVDINDAQSLQADYQEQEGVYQVVNQRETLDRVFNILGGVQNLTLLIALVQGLAALMLVANTIQVAAYSKRREVAIMKLVGASNWFVQAPFVLEAVFAGIIGALFAFGTLVVAKIFLMEGTFQDLFSLMPPIAWNPVLVLLPILAGVAAIISAATAWITLRFNIKV